ncbi:uncharacterized protein LOC119090868 [Pollicipes pollicipes]|uniref:uncharacterized protein LOC119090868 n=1 Tax=Pollicipes pollicipes TaxID=41117 RepID=UPI001884F954|nr:uncharacterized protein LOC119090868 [Pollicipes pollicipes]
MWLEACSPNRQLLPELIKPWQSRLPASSYHLSAGSEFRGFFLRDDRPQLPEGPEGVAPRLAAPPLGFRGAEQDTPAADGREDEERKDDQDDDGPVCPMCLDRLRKEDFSHYPLEGRCTWFGMTEDQLEQSLLPLTDEHVLAAAPGTVQLRKRQVELARERGCQ